MEVVLHVPPELGEPLRLEDQEEDDHQAEGRLLNVRQEAGHGGLARLEIVDSMHVRKMRMFDLSDAFCALPGGLGTLDETFEIVTWKQLGLHDAPVILVNLGGYWDPLLQMVAHQAAAGFVRPQHQQLFQVVDSVEALFDALEAAEPPSLKADSRKL